MPWTYTLEPATRKDGAALLDVANAANTGSPIYEACYPPHLSHLTPPEQFREWRLNRAAIRFEEADVVNMKVIAQDELNGVDGKIIGLATWFSPNYDYKGGKMAALMRNTHAETKSDEVGVTMDSDTTAQPDTDKTTQANTKDQMPACVNRGFLDHQHQIMGDLNKEVWGSEPPRYWYLAALATHPDWQRKGVAKMLLQWGLDQADKDGVYTYLEATPVGKLVYERAGFVSAGSRELLTGWDMTAMKRPPIPR